jgi:predicted nucleic acid-binding protein
MTYLVDTNVLLEAGLKRTQWEQAASFLGRVPANQLAVADFSLHSLGFFLAKRTPELFNAMIQDVLERKLHILSVEPSKLSSVMETTKLHGLDFDDAYIYVVAELYDLNIVSLDSDFDRTPRGRMTPAHVVSSLGSE